MMKTIALALALTSAAAFAPTLNGWTPDSKAFCYGLPGALAPVGNFDPAGFAEGRTVDQVKMLREAEVTHGRVSMLAVVGFLVQENFHPIFPDVGGPGARQLDIVLQDENGQALGACLLFGVMLTEIQRAKTGWMDPDEAMQELRPEYTPGDLGFDPLGMAPKTEEDMMKMKNKELNNGRLAMMAVAGIVAQEVVTGQELLGSA